MYITELVTIQPIHKNKSFLLLMSGEIVAGITMWVCLLLNLQFMSQIMKTNLGTGLLLMTGMLASILFLPTVGKMIDLYDKQKILIASSCLRCLAPIFMYLAISYTSIGWLVASLIVNQVAGSMYLPTVRAGLPALVGEANLLSANTLYMNIATMARIAGTAVGGLLLTVFTMQAVTMGAVIGFLILVIIVLFVRIPKSHHKRKQTEKLKFIEVFEIMKKEPSVTVGLISTGVVTLFLGGFNLLVLAFGKLQDSSTIMGYIYAIEGASVLLAGFFVQKLVSQVNLVRVSSLLVVVIGIAEWGMSFSTSPVMVLLSFGLLGFTLGFIFPMVTTVFQKRLPEMVQGRFFSFKEIVDRIIIQVAMLLTSASLDFIGISPFLILMSIFTVCTGLLTYLYGKRQNLVVTHLGSQNESK
ncbi:MFS transporter [Brevibacillus laterosporus]|uniref:MFS transporter n=1 Tax=Brevibacillus laterosporus TaxID=1465 RepID=UPI000EACBF0A|nr:MFS transporter [Brevibacillus laterosporus]AYK05088.1 MFS transporter [Brevibacillus laterosporus]